MEAIDIVRAIYEAYARRDIATGLGYCADDVVFTWAADPNHSRHAGYSGGKGAFLARLMELDAEFEYREFRPIDIIGSGDRVAAQCEIHLTRRATGRQLIMRTANFWTVRDGQVVEMVEYYDTALAAAVL